MRPAHESQVNGTLRRVWRFLEKPPHEKARSLYFRWSRAFPNIPVPIRLPFGGWWLVRNDRLGATLFDDAFEKAECSFVERFLRPGMTVLDIGAHHGYYTLLASRKVGPEGKVIAFEPSPRERHRLSLHLRLINGCKNVETEQRAVGENEETGHLHLVLGIDSGCNSLRKPAVSQQTDLVPIRVERLDHILHERRIEHVDFIKLDVEGDKLSVLKGAMESLLRHPRPVILAEVQDIRTKPWGYPAKEIVRCLCDIGFLWFAPRLEGHLEEIDMEQEKYDGKFIAIPEERVADLREMMSGKKGKIHVSGWWELA